MCLLRCTLMSKFSSQENLCLQFLGSQGTLIPWNLTRFPTYLIKPRRHTVAIACFCIRASEWDDAQGPTSDFLTVACHRHTLVYQDPQTRTKHHVAWPAYPTRPRTLSHPQRRKIRIYGQTPRQKPRVRLDPRKA